MSRPQAAIAAAADAKVGTRTARFMFWYFIIVVGRPHELIPGLSTVPFAKVAIAGALLAAISDRAAMTVKLWSLPLARTALYFFALATISILFSIWPGNTFHAIVGGITSLTISFIIVVKISRNWHATRIVIDSIPYIAALLAVSVLLTTAGGRPDGTSYYDPNDLAFAMVTLFPIVLSLSVGTTGLRRLTLWFLAFLMVVATLLTQSRGGLIGLCIVVLGLSLFPLDPKVGQISFGKKLGRMLAKLAVVCIVGAASWNFLPTEARDRLMTVFSLQDDYNMTETAGRSSIWKRNAAATLSRPIGYGLSSFAAVDLRTGGKFKAAHNSFVQVLVELGFLGLFLFLRMYYLSWRNLSKAGHLQESTLSDADGHARASLCRAFGLSLAGMMVCGFFLSQAFTNLVWMIFALVTAVTVWNFPAALATGVLPRMRRGTSRAPASTAVSS